MTLGGEGGIVGLFYFVLFSSNKVNSLKACSNQPPGPSLNLFE